ncbi:hypothetical protein KKB18_06000 [bacterium]|nr:hypothetical protein [bacterium]
MKNTQDTLGNLVNYKAIFEIQPLELPKVEKRDIPKFILCQNFDKARQKIDRKMERYNNKVDQLKGKIQQSEIDIAAMQKQQQKWSRKSSTFLLDRTDVKAVEKQNHAADNANRLLEKIQIAFERQEDLMEQHNEAIEEATEKLEEMNQEALLVIDEDIVTVLDKLTQTINKFSDQENPADLASALEICFIALKVFNTFEEHIDGNVPRKDAKERVAEIIKLCARLCEKGTVRNFFVDLFHRNTSLIKKNADLYNHLVEKVKSVDKEELSTMTQRFQVIYSKTLNTDFKYEGIVDPSELEAVVVEIRKTIDAVKANIGMIKELYNNSKATAEAGVNAQQNVVSLLTTMKTNMEEMRDDIFVKGHFACDMVDKAVIEDFYNKDLRPAVTGLREYIVGNIGKEQLDTLFMEGNDRYSIEKAETAIKQAGLLSLQAQRDQTNEHTKKLSAMINDRETDIQKADEVPQKNADAFRSATSILYISSLLPVIGFAFALSILSKFTKFSLAFKSNNKVYRELGSIILSKNKTMQTVNLVIGVVLGIGGVGVLFGLNVSPEVFFNVGIPGTVLVFYLITWKILAISGKKLKSYIEISK